MKKNHFFVPVLFFILFSFFSNNFVFSQTADEKCREMNKLANKKSLEYRDANLNVEIKKNELTFATNMQRVADAESRKIVLNPNDLEKLEIKVELETKTGNTDKTLEERNTHKEEMNNMVEKR